MQNSQTETKKPLKKTRKKNRFHRLKIFLTGVTATISLGAALYPFWPHIEIELNGPTNPINAFSVPSVITNIGIFPLENIQVTLGRGTMTFINKNISFNMWRKNHPETSDIHDASKGPTMTNKNWFRKKLRLDEKMSIYLSDEIAQTGESKLYYADISIVVFYNLWIFPIRFEKQQRFSTRIRTDGLIDWLYEPVEK